MKHAKSVKLAEGTAPPEQTTRIEIWTDGACKGNPGSGRLGRLAALRGPREGTLRRRAAHDQQPHGADGGHRGAFVAEAPLRRRSFIRIRKYVQLGITEWIPNWIRRGWKTADRKPVKNADLWQRLHEVAARHDVHWRWVKGHAGVDGNERADELANRGVESVSSSHRSG